MTNESQKQNATVLDEKILDKLIINGDLKALTDEQKVAYYNHRCQQAGLDPAAKPFDLLILNGKQVLYANAACTQQLTSIHGLSHQITGKEILNGVYVVCVRVTGKDSRTTENMGATTVDNIKGDALCNAMMKATTKAIRRTVLAHCGLGMLDETETETIPGAQKVDLNVTNDAQPSYTPIVQTAKQEPTKVDKSFKKKYDSVEDLSVQLKSAETVKEVAALYYANAEMVEANPSFKIELSKYRDELYSQGKTGE